MPRLKLNVDIEDLLNDVSAEECVEHYGEESILNEIGLDVILEYATENSDHNDILQYLDESAIVDFLNSKNYSVEEKN